MGYISTVVCCRCLCKFRNSALELTLQNVVNLCNQRPPEGIRMHQIRFAPGLRPGPRWGSSRRSPRPPSRMGRGKPPPHTSPPRRLRRLDPGAFGACCFAPNLFFVPARLPGGVVVHIRLGPDLGITKQAIAYGFGRGPKISFFAFNFCVCTVGAYCVYCSF